MNKLLERQIRKFLSREKSFSAEWEQFLQAVDKAYDGFESDRALMERAFDLSSDELQGINEKLKDEIVEKGKMQEMLRAEKDRVREYLDIAGVMFLILDRDANVTMVNKKGCQILGYEQEEIIGKNWIESFIHRDRQKDVCTVFDNIVKGKVDLFEYNEYPVVTRDGRERVIAWHNALLRDAGGNPAGMLSSGEDVTAQKAAEQEVRKKEERFRALVANIPGIVYRCSVDTQWTVKYISEGVERITGYPAEEFMNNGKYNMIGITHPDDVEMVRRQLQEAIEEKSPYVIEARVIHKDGGIRWVYEQGRVTFDDVGRPLWVDGVMLDVTEKKKAAEELSLAYEKLQETQQQLIQSSKMAAMGQLAAGISHELNQPLTGIKGFAQAVRADIDPQSPFREDLDKIITQADRMDKIIKNIRSFARKSDFICQATDINKVIEDALILLREQLRVRNIKIKTFFAEGLPEVNGDANQLQQVFINLITNARDAIDCREDQSGGVLRVESRLNADRRHIDVVFEDTGCGIPTKEQEHIFNPFYTTKSPGRGIGLGLSIIYRIIENHRGRIDVRSSPGRGTTFTISLPVFIP